MSAPLTKTDDIHHIQTKIERIESDIQRITNKLNNDGFIARVPAAMIENEQKKMAQFEREKRELEIQMRLISNA
ncbi:MAG: hypothetical protein IBX52_12545 [Bacterioplanes sp.]|nr:hypothetical protein [Bacterioplanes sp.]